MRKESVVLFSCLMSVAVFAAPGASMAQNGPYYQGGAGVVSESWTLAIFVSGDNNLEGYWDSASLPGLLSLPANEDLSIVAYIDRLSVDGTEVVEISGGVPTTAATYDEMNFGDGPTFEWFLEDVALNYPSDKLAVIAWDHGYAWRYISDDDSSGGDRITMPEFQAAIEGAGVYIDVLAFDACNMASIEVEYQVALTGMAGIIVASEESVPTTGFPYDTMFLPTAEDASRTPAEMATDMVLAFQAFYEPQTWASTVSLSAVSVPAVLEAADELQAWTASMLACLPLYEDSYKQSLRESYIAWCTHYHVDIADLGDTILADPSMTDESLRASTSAMVVAVDGSVIAHWGGSAALDNRGLTLWWGVDGDWKAYSEAYAEVAYAQDMGWWAFLDGYRG
ncbi:MAG: clostripain-related cysteine peptidase [Candidatus Thermoplasmatota archaeon]